MEFFVILRYFWVGVGERQTVKHVAEDLSLAIGADDFGHIGERLDHLLCDVDITILSYEVLLQDLSIINMHVARLTFTAHEFLEVVVSDLLLGHVLLSEV